MKTVLESVKVPMSIRLKGKLMKREDIESFVENGSPIEVHTYNEPFIMYVGELPYAAVEPLIIDGAMGVQIVKLFSKEESTEWILKENS